jgi:hypothetical protein
MEEDEEEEEEEEEEEDEEEEEEEDEDEDEDEDDDDEEEEETISSFLSEEHAYMDMDVLRGPVMYFEILHYGQADGQNGEQYNAYL